MSPWMRRGLWALVAVVVLVGAAVAWLVASFDPNRFKGTAIAWMKEHRQRTLVLDGPIELSVFPRLAVRLSKVQLSEHARPETFAALDEAGLAVEVLPLLRGELVVGRVSAKGVRLAYLRDAQGRSNIDDLVAPSPASPASPASGAAGGPALRFDVSGIDLADVRARVKDDVAKVDGEMALQRLVAGRLADGATAPVELAARFDFRQPAVKGDLTGRTELTLRTGTGSVALRGMSLQFKGDVPGATAVDATLKGALAWDGARKGVDAEGLTLQFAGHAGGLKLADSRLAIDRFTFEPARKALALRKLQARLKGTQGAQPLAVELDWPELSVEGDRLGGGPFSGKVQRGGDMPIDATFRSGAPSGGFDAVRLPGFVAQWASRAPERKLDGTLHADLLLKPAEPSLALDALKLDARLEEAKLPPYAVAVTGQAVGSTQRSSWNLRGQLNGSPFTTEGDATLAGVTPHVRARARFDAIDLNRLLGPEAPPAKGAAGGGGPAGGDAPVDLTGLRKLDGSFSLHAGRFAYRQYRVDDATLEAALQGGMLRVTQLQGRVWGGQVSASAFADARASRVAAKGSASGVNVNALLRDVASKDLIEGTGRVTFDLDSAGRTVQEMKSHLKGTAALQVRDGAIKGVNLAKALRQAKAALSLKQDAAMKATQTEKTDFSELSASFQVQDGVARSRDLDLKSPFLRLGGEGAVDVGRNRIDYVARATVASTTKGQDGADLAALRGITVPVRLAGPLEAPDWRIEWSAVAAQAVTRQLQEKLGEKLGERLGLPSAGSAASGAAPKDALRDRLKGLFK